MDEQGSKIQGTFFKETVDKFDELLQENNVYIFTSGLVKEAVVKFATVKHEYCIVFDATTTIEQVDDDGTVKGSMGDQPGCFSFVSIASLEETKAMEVVDILAVVRQVGPLGQVTTKSGEVRKRRNVILCDDSNASIILCIWGDKVNMNLKLGNPVVAIKSAKVSDYFQKSLNLYEDGRLFANCSFERAKDMKLWYECLVAENTCEFTQLSSNMEALITQPPSND